jgi:anti-sigma-K factor RskA
MERLNTAATRALNALPDDERSEFDDAIALDEYLLAHVESFRLVALELADGLPEIVPVASPIIWDRIVDETGIDQPTSEQVPIAVSLHPRRSNYLASVAAVAAAHVIGIVAGNQLSSSSPDMAQLATAAAAEPTSTNLELVNPAAMTDVNASAVLAEDGTGYVIGNALPTLNSDRTYQLWVVVDGAVISAGLLGNDPSVIQFRAEGDMAGMAISNEAPVASSFPRMTQSPFGCATPNGKQ